MLMKCNANISIPGAMRNVNEMQMKCNANKYKINAEFWERSIKGAKKCGKMFVCVCLQSEWFILGPPS